MRRRTALRTLAGLAAGAWLVPERLRAQSGPVPRAGPDSAAADRLYDPSAVQERAAASSGDNEPAVKALEHRLKCTCGCNLDVYTCRTTDFTCTYSPGLHKELLALRAEGKSDDAVIAAFVAKYGEQILMAPEPHGFNLAGYLLPGSLVLLAGSVLAFVLLRRGRTTAPAPVPAPAREAGSAEAERLRRALAELED